MAAKTEVPVKAEEKPIARREPFDLFTDLQTEMSRLWSQTWPFGPWPMAQPMPRLFEMPTTWTPRMDVFEKNGNLIVKAELPGVKKEDIQVTLDQGNLIIGGERKAESEIKKEDYHRIERSYGSFYRRLPLSAEVKTDQIKATFQDGVLEVRIPKPMQEKPQPHKIAIT